MGNLSFYTAIDESTAQGLLKRSEEEVEAFLFEAIWDKEQLSKWDLDLDKSALDLHRCFTGERYDGLGRSYPLNKCFFGDRVICNTETYANLILPHEVNDIAKELIDVNLDWLQRRYNQYKPWQMDKMDYWESRKSISNFWGLLLKKPIPPTSEEIESSLDYLFEYADKMKHYFTMCSDNTMAVVFTSRP